MQTELKREWLRQLLIICNGLLEEEKSLLDNYIDRMDNNHVVILEEREMNNELLMSLLQRGMLEYCKDCEMKNSFVIIPRYIGIGNLSGLGISLVVKEYEGELVVSKEFQKFKPVLNDIVS